MTSPSAPTARSTTDALAASEQEPAGPAIGYPPSWLIYAPPPPARPPRWATGQSRPHPRIVQALMTLLAVEALAAAVGVGWQVASIARLHAADRHPNDTNMLANQLNEGGHGLLIVLAVGAIALIVLASTRLHSPLLRRRLSALDMSYCAQAILALAGPVTSHDPFLAARVVAWTITGLAVGTTAVSAHRRTRRWARPVSYPTPTFGPPR